MREFGFVASILLLLFFSFSIPLFLYNLKPVSLAPETLEIKIDRGEGLKEIGSALSRKKAIRSVFVFKTYAILSGAAHRFKPGVYKISTASTTPQIISSLVAGPRQDVAVFIPEGATVMEIDRLLADAGVLKRGELVGFSYGGIFDEYPFFSEAVISRSVPGWFSGLEGFLFPDTYRFQVGSAPEQAVKKFLDNFEIRAWPMLVNRTDWYELLITASVLEKEIPYFEDRRTVAGIIEKRIKEFIPIQVDATLVYLKCNGDFSGCDERLLSREDFDNETPFNTYKSLGLPPAPISNPGLSALEAALSPQPSPYWYYLSDRRTKNTIFSTTLDEHNDNRAKYLGL